MEIRFRFFLNTVTVFRVIFRDSRYFDFIIIISILEIFIFPYIIVQHFHQFFAILGENLVEIKQTDHIESDELNFAESLVIDAIV